MLAGLA